jgi:hypothetical protein
MYNYFLPWANVLVSTNNIARGMVRGSQVRFQSTKSTFSILKTIYVIVPPLSDLPIRFSFPLSFLTCSAGRTCYLWHHCFRNPWRKALISSSIRPIGKPSRRRLGAVVTTRCLYTRSRRRPKIHCSSACYGCPSRSAVPVLDHASQGARVRELV